MSGASIKTPPRRPPSGGPETGRLIDLGNRRKALYGRYREKYRPLGLIER
jgi:hypothetical protein